MDKTKSAVFHCLVNFKVYHTNRCDRVILAILGADTGVVATSQAELA
jgi:hypothetical protein